MKRLLILLPATLFAFPALAQEAPEGSYRDLWCGLAFASAAEGVPYSEEDVAAAKAAGDQATDEQKMVLEQADMVTAFTEGGSALVDRATASYKEAGFTDESFGTVRSDLEPKVAAQVNGSASDAEFTFEECSSVLPEDNAMYMPMEGAPAGDNMPATDTTTPAPGTDAPAMGAPAMDAPAGSTPPAAPAQ